MDQDRLLSGALLIVAAELMFAFMGASIRLVSTDLNNGMVVFARNLVGLLSILSLVAHPHHRKLRTRVPHLHLLRSAAKLGPFAFFSVVFGAALGWMFWDEILGWLTVAGTLLVLSSATPVGRGMPHTTAVAVNAG